MTDDRNILRAVGKPRPAYDVTASAAEPDAPLDEPVTHPRFTGPRRRRPRLKKLRLVLILLGLGILAAVSTMFGAMMALSAELPSIDSVQALKAAKNSTIYDSDRKFLGALTRKEAKFLVPYDKISRHARRGVVAVEDQRFWTNEGVDLQGVGRALWADISAGKPVQGASTITQQLIKNSLAAQKDRTVLQKMREAGLAFHLTRKWSKRKILTEYLNAIYFGNGAYGVESAARTYFGRRHPSCGGTPGSPPCASLLTPDEGALLAGMIASPGTYDPTAYRRRATRRRNLVLQRMQEQGYLTEDQYRQYRSRVVPGRGEVQPPREKSPTPYFTTWVKQQVIERFGAARAFDGGLKVYTTIDRELQEQARAVIEERFPPGSDGPTAALVAIDNKTGEVKAMYGGSDKAYNQNPFNLATQGQRQPGSAFKPFVLAAALKSGISPTSVWSSEKKTFRVPNSSERFVVRNYEDNYSGSTTLARATTFSDNSVYSEVGIKVGVKRIARLSRKMGIRTPVSGNYALTLGAMKEGVTPLDMAHAYQTLARGGRLVTGTLAASGRGPVGIEKVTESDGDPLKDEKCPRRKCENRVKERRVLPQEVADTTTGILKTVLTDGTAANAAIDGFAAGKTGTTEDYGDAWFVGFDRRYTVAVWVGYPDSTKSMETDYGGSPVAGGTYPADIWRDFMVAARDLYAKEHPNAPDPNDEDTGPAAPGTEGDGTGGESSGGQSEGQGGEGDGEGEGEADGASDGDGGGEGDTGDGGQGDAGGGGQGEAGDGGGGGDEGGGGAAPGGGATAGEG